jgi:transposase
VPMLAELIDAVVGVDTHRDTHHVEIALPTGTPIATCSISNDTAGYAHLLAWILDHAPGPRIAVSIEGCGCPKPCAHPSTCPFGSRRCPP